MSPHHMASGLGVLLVAGLVPGAAPAVAPVSSPVQRAAASVRRPRWHRCRADAEVRAADRHRGDGLVLLPGPGRPRRRRPAGDRRAVLLDVRVRRQRTGAGPGPGEQGPRLCPVGGRRSRGRRRHRHRGRWQLGHRGGVRVPRRPAAAQGRVAGVHEQRRSVPGGPWARRRGPERRRPGRGRGDDDQHGSQGRPGLRLRRERAAVPAGGTSPRLASQPGLRRLRRERRHREHRRRPGAGDPRHLRQPPDQRLQPRRHLDPCLALVHQPRVGSTRGSGWPGETSSGGPARRSSGATTTSTRERGRARPASRGCSGPPRRRRWPTWTATATTR